MGGTTVGPFALLAGGAFGELLPDDEAAAWFGLASYFLDSSALLPDV